MKSVADMKSVAHTNSALRGQLNRIAAWLLLLALCVATSARAEQYVSVGAYQVHYVVIGSTFLTPEIARRYHLERNREVAMLNISVLRDGKPVAARITGVARDLLSREIALTFREVREPPAIYYLSQLRFTEQEHWRFRLNVQPVGEPEPLAVQFEQRIYVE